MASKHRRYEKACDFLKENNLRFSRQRMIVVDELFFNSENDIHFKVNDLVKRVKDNHNTVISGSSLTNILKGLCAEGLIRELYTSKPYYDTNTKPHMHLYDIEGDELIDVYGDENIELIKNNINIPENKKIRDVNCIITLEDNIAN